MTAQALVYLFTVWSVDVRCLVRYQRVFQLEAATLVKVIPHALVGTKEVVPLEKKLVSAVGGQGTALIVRCLLWCRCTVLAAADYAPDALYSVMPPPRRPQRPSGASPSLAPTRPPLSRDPMQESQPVVGFTFRQLRFLYDTDAGCFKKLKYPTKVCACAFGWVVKGQVCVGGDYFRDLLISPVDVIQRFCVGVATAPKPRQW